MRDKTLCIIGFGNQAQAWALNLRDSGWALQICARPGAGRQRAQQLGFSLCDESELGMRPPGSAYALLTPDHTHREVLDKLALAPQSLILLAHGHSWGRLQLGEHFPHHRFLLLAPKAIASELRFAYETHKPLSAIINWEQAPAEQAWLEKLARDLGLGHGLFKASFQQEAQADLFSEQSLLCSLLPFGALECFKLLRSRGFSPELAYLECWFEIKLIAQTMVDLGPQKFFELVSPTALWGGWQARAELCDGPFIQRLEHIMKRIESGEFDRQLESIDFKQLKKEVASFWQAQELQQVHQRYQRRDLSPQASQ